MSETWSNLYKAKKMPSLRGWFLMAAPHLLDPNFYRTVVLLLQHNEDGAFGLVLNRPMSKTVREVWQQSGRGECAFDGPLYLGGPVTGPLIALHNDAECAEGEVIDGVYFAASPDVIDRLLNDPPEQLRVFTFYSGWAGGQLESELDEGAWITLPATPELIFCGEEDLWRRVGRLLQQRFFSAVLKPYQIPPDASLN